MNKRILLLNGPSSSGKSTLAYTLQSMVKENCNKDYGVTSIDDFLKMTTDEVIYEDDVFKITAELCDSANDILGSCHGVIIDHVITSERIFNPVIASFNLEDVCLIHVTCPLLELVIRENKRRNRCLGSAKASYQYLFPKDGYDLTVDTCQLSINECCTQIMRLLL